MRAPEASRGCEHPNLEAVPTGSDTVPSLQLSQVSLRDINRVIDESILPEEFFSVRNGRHVVAAGCPLIAFYFESARWLTAAISIFPLIGVWSQVRGRLLSLRIPGKATTHSRA